MGNVLVHRATVQKVEKVRVSPKFKAILGAMLDQEWTEPRVVALTATSDGFFLGMLEGDVGFNEFFGAVSDLRRNVLGLAEVAQLNEIERTYLESRIPRSA